MLYIQLLLNIAIMKTKTRETKKIEHFLIGTLYNLKRTNRNGKRDLMPHFNSSSHKILN